MESYERGEKMRLEVKIMIGLLIFVGFMLILFICDINYKGMKCEKYETVCRKYIGIGIGTQAIQISCDSMQVELRERECVKWVSKNNMEKKSNG